MTYIGTGIPSTTNTLLAAGVATYVDDVAIQGCLTMLFVRSPHASARIIDVDTSLASAHPGVIATFTGADVVGDTEIVPSGVDGSMFGAKAVDRYCLATDRVHYVGDPVAAVVATDADSARAARDLVRVDYETLPPITDADSGLSSDAPLVEPSWENNVLLEFPVSAGDVDAAFAAAAGHVTGHLTSARVAPCPIETRGTAASWDRAQSKLTCWVSTQGPHVLRSLLAEALALPDESIRVVQPQVGGAFGGKFGLYQEDVLVCHAARTIGRPVKWIEDRASYFAAGGHARDMRCSYEAAHDETGRITSLRADLVADVGAPSPMLGWVMAMVALACMPGSYKVDNVDMRVRVVVTNKAPWQGYRGFGKELANFFLERILDHVATSAGLTGPEVRLRNFIGADEFPYIQPSGWTTDSGDYPGTLELALEMIGYSEFPVLRAEARERGRLLGIGVAHELTPEGQSAPGSLYGGTESATVRISPNGLVSVLTGVTSPGTGNETGIAQIVAQELGCEFSRVHVVQGDTDRCPFGAGNYSSRSLVIGGSTAGLAAGDLRDKLLTVAASMLEAAVADIDLVDGCFSVRGTGTQLTFEGVVQEVHLHPHGAHMDGVDPGLEVSRSYKMPNVDHQPWRTGRLNLYPTWPFGAAACIVEVDPETGHVTVERYVFAHDAGKIVNPVLADAQLQGAVMQGIGAALYESIQYDNDGGLETQTMMDYGLPTSMESVTVEIGHRETPSPFTHLGMKGVGESGVSAPSPAIASAIDDALAHIGVRMTETPFTPARVWQAINQAGVHS